MNKWIGVKARDTTNSVAKECIVLAMDEIRQNLKESALNEDVETNAKAMLILSEAYKNVE